MIVVTGTSGLLAALDRTHPACAAARSVLREAGTLILSPVLLGEFDHVGRRVLGRDATYQAIDDIRRWVRAGRAVLPGVTAEILDTAQAVRARYVDLQLDLADAVNVALAAQFHTNAVLTLDRRDSAPYVRSQIIEPSACCPTTCDGYSWRAHFRRVCTT